MTENALQLKVIKGMHLRVNQASGEIDGQKFEISTTIGGLVMIECRFKISYKLHYHSLVNTRQKRGIHKS